MSPTIFGKPLRIRCLQCDAVIQDVYCRLTDFDKVLYIRVRCHGAVDSMECQMADLYQVLHHDRVEAVAFMAPPSIYSTPAPP